MQICCTKKLLDQIKIKPEETSQEVEPLFSWHANLITIDRRKTIVLVNDQNRYAIILYGLKAKDFTNLDQIILQGIRETLQEEGIKAEIIDEFLTKLPNVTYSKTRGRSLVARMNQACEYAHYYIRDHNPNSVFQPRVSAKLSRSLVGTGAKDYYRPNEAMYQALKNFIKQDNIFETEAVTLKITLKLDNRNIWRRLIVPTNITFSKLHEILQVAFNWKDYHLYEFYIFGEDRKVVPGYEGAHYNHSGYLPDGSRATLNLVCDEEAFDYGDDKIPMKLACDFRLRDSLQDSKIWNYTYDFGDNWVHLIEVENILEDYDKNYSICLEGEGNAPPEDVGGEPGFEEFLRVISDKDDPDYEHMSAWGKSQGYSEFSVEEINFRLQRI